MALVVGTNAYIDVAGATAYLSDRLYADAWTNATPTNQAAALVTATRVIERQLLRGKPAATTQALAFPRCYPPAQFPFRLNVPSGLYANPLTSYDGPLQLDRTFGYGYPQEWICETAVPQEVLDAVCEEALALLAQDAVTRDRRALQHAGVTSARSGDVAESYATGSKGRSVTPSAFASLEAKDRMRPFLAGSVRIA